MFKIGDKIVYPMRSWYCKLLKKRKFWGKSNVLCYEIKTCIMLPIRSDAGVRKLLIYYLGGCYWILQEEGVTSKLNATQRQG